MTQANKYKRRWVSVGGQKNFRESFAKWDKQDNDKIYRPLSSLEHFVNLAYIRVGVSVALSSGSAWKAR